MNYLDAFERTVRVHGADTALVTEGGRTFAYREFDRRSDRLVNALADRVGDDPVAVLAANSVASVEAMVAGHKRGVPTVQLPYREGAGELRLMTEATGATALVYDDENAETARRLLDQGGFKVALHASEGDPDPAEAVESYEAALDAADPGIDDRYPLSGSTNVFFTSGTTSLPKGVAFDGEAMWLGAYQGVMEHGIDRTDVAVVATPWYHMVTSDAWLYPHWLAGATTVLLEGFDPERVLAAIESHGAAGLLAVPTQLRALNDARAAGDYDVSSLEYVRTGGAVVTEDLVERTGELLCEGVFNTYGLTEGGPNLTFAHPSVQDEHPGTVGKESFSWELRVVETAPVDEHPDPSATVDPGGRGEIIARGPGVPDGYVDNPTAESRTFFDEWLRTRDVARIDEDGYLYVIDRVDNMFVSGGENVYPAEVERALTDHPDVEEALVFGVEDDHWGRRVTAVVVVDDDVDEDDLDAHCLDHESLADFKRPRDYAIRRDPLPRTDTGTVERERVIEEHFE